MIKKNITKKKLFLNKKLKLKRRSNRLNRRYVMRGGDIKSEYDKITKIIKSNIENSSDPVNFVNYLNKANIDKEDENLLEKFDKPSLIFTKQFLPKLYNLIKNYKYDNRKLYNATLEFITTESTYIFKLYLILYIINETECNVRDDLNACILPIFNFHLSFESYIDKKLLGNLSIDYVISLIINFMNNFSSNYKVIQNYTLIFIIKDIIINNYGIIISKPKFKDYEKLKIFESDLLIEIFQRFLKYKLLLSAIKNNYENDNLQRTMGIYYNNTIKKIDNTIKKNR